jgi:hypothetical protein
MGKDTIIYEILPNEFFRIDTLTIKDFYIGLYAAQITSG